MIKSCLIAASCALFISLVGCDDTTKIQGEKDEENKDKKVEDITDEDEKDGLELGEF